MRPHEATNDKRDRMANPPRVSRTIDALVGQIQFRRAYAEALCFRTKRFLMKAERAILVIIL